MKLQMKAKKVEKKRGNLRISHRNAKRVAYLTESQSRATEEPLAQFDKMLVVDSKEKRKKKGGYSKKKWLFQCQRKPQVRNWRESPAKGVTNFWFNVETHERQAKKGGVG